MAPGNRQTDPRHAGGVSHGEGVACRQGDFVADGDLPAQVQQKNLVRDIDDLDFLHLVDGPDDFLDVLMVPRPHRDVARHPLGFGVDDVHGAEVPAVMADDLRQLGEHANPVGISQPHDKAVADRRRWFRGGHKSKSIQIASSLRRRSKKSTETAGEL